MEVHSKIEIGTKFPPQIYMQSISGKYKKTARRI